MAILLTTALTPDALWSRLNRPGARWRLIFRLPVTNPRNHKPWVRASGVSWNTAVERVTGIEPAQSAWKAIAPNIPIG
jgi:hypothetical protein